MYLLDVEPLDLGTDVRAVGLELTEADENREPVRGPDAARVWSRVLRATAADEIWALDFFSHLDRVREYCLSLIHISEEAALFAARLQKDLGIEVELVDERLTSWEAAQTMAEVKSSSRRKRAPIDDVAAAVLLRDYLEHKKQLERSSVPIVERTQS